MGRSVGVERTLEPLRELRQLRGARLRSIARRHLAAGKFLVTLGGEHSLTTAPVRAARAIHGELGVVQFDAHADLRPEYDGTPWSHASVMRRLHEDGIPALAVGIRAVRLPALDHGDIGPGHSLDFHGPRRCGRVSSPDLEYRR